MLPPPSQVENDLQADGGGQSKPDSAPASASGGILIPPTNIKSMVDKATRFVASLQPRVEKMIIDDGTHNYSFMYAADPYHAYYQHQVSELRAQNGTTADIWPKWLTDEVLKGVNERMEETRKRYKIMGEIVAAAAAVTVVSPITGELIPVNKMFQHMQKSVTDPKYKEQKEILFAKIRETTLAQDDEISIRIVGLAQTRPGVFGTTEDELSNAVKAEIQRTKLVLDMDGVPFVPPPPMREPKRRRLDDSWLVPEDQFLAQHPGPVCISVCVPETGRMLEVSVESSSESVSSLKEKIAGEIEVPAKKQKLSGKAGLFKDNLSLAYYNVSGGEMLSLSWS